ncbi:hypothetical protein ScPMuIL_018314 [Solemya velum]
MAGDGEMELHVWKGDWNLPSVDPNCLAALAYCKFAGVPVCVKKTNNPWKSPSGELPVLIHGKVTETSINNIFGYLRKQNWGSDFDLTNKQSADVIAYTSLLEEKLLPALLHSWWIDGKTYVDVTRPWYAKAAPFPLNFFLPGQKQRQASDRVYTSKGIGENVLDTEIDAKIYKEAKECLNHLSYKLGDQDFFFGSSPSSLDALVFGFLAPILNAPLPGSQLTNHLRGCPNLCSLCTKIIQRFFPPSAEDIDTHKKEKQEEKKMSDASLDFPHKKRNMFLSAIFAAIAMVGYAFMSGLVQIEVVDEEKESSPSPAKPSEPSNFEFQPLFTEDDEQQEDS